MGLPFGIMMSFISCRVILILFLRQRGSKNETATEKG